MKQNLVFKILAVTIIYLLFRYMGGTLGMHLLYPITLLVTFLHEFGHGTAAVITGGSVQGLHIATDGSGLCTTLGGNTAAVLMGGYIGSAFFGNLLFYIGAKAPGIQRITIALLGGLMAFVGIFWFQDWLTTTILIVFAAVLYFLATRHNLPGIILMFFGIASIIYIIEDFNTGPRSDLEKYASIVGVLPADIWMYVWLFAVVLMSVYNLQLILNRNWLSRLKW